VRQAQSDPREGEEPSVTQLRGCERVVPSGFGRGKRTFKRNGAVQLACEAGQHGPPPVRGVGPAVTRKAQPQASQLHSRNYLTHRVATQLNWRECFSALGPLAMKGLVRSPAKYRFQSSDPMDRTARPYALGRRRTGCSRKFQWRSSCSMPMRGILTADQQPSNRHERSASL
jgi:hypothetical protein